MGARGAEINRLQKELRVRMYFEFFVRIHILLAPTFTLADTIPCTQEQTAFKEESIAGMQSSPQKSVAAMQSPPQKSVAAMQSPHIKPQVS